MAARYEHVLTPAVLDVWKRFPADSIITSYILDILEEFSRNANYFPALYTRLLPFLDQIFKTPSTDQAVLSVSPFFVVLFKKAGWDD